MKSFWWIVLSVFTLSCAHAECPPKCTCTKTVTNCRSAGLDQLPASVPETTEVFLFNSNGVKTITALDKSYANVREFSILSNAITDIEDEAFSHLSNLTKLLLDGNRLTILRKKMFSGLKSLTELSVANNLITKLKSHDMCPGSVPNIKYVNAQNNQITSIAADVFGSRSNLTEFRLSGNKLSEFPSGDFMKTVPSLLKLELNRNPLTSVPDYVFQGSDRLTYLNIDSCELTRLSGKSFSGLNSLTELRLGNNQIWFVSSDAFKGLESLRVLHLQNNRMQTLTKESLSASRLTDLQLKGNPWNCNCSIAWMKDSEIEAINRINITCSTPAVLAGRLISSVGKQEFPCERPSRKMSLVLAIVIPIVVGLVLLLLISIYCLIKRRQRDDSKAVRYSAVYKETVEKRPEKNSPDRPVSEL